MKKKHALALILALFTLLATGCAAQKDGQTTDCDEFLSDVCADAERDGRR